MDTIKCTFEATTQHACIPMSAILKIFQYPNPVNVQCCNEPLATDTVYSTTSPVDMLEDEFEDKTIFSSLNDRTLSSQDTVLGNIHNHHDYAELFHSQCTLPVSHESHMRSIMMRTSGCGLNCASPLVHKCFPIMMTLFCKLCVNLYHHQWRCMYLVALMILVMGNLHLLFLGSPLQGSKLLVNQLCLDAPRALLVFLKYNPFYKQLQLVSTS